ncbi:MAG: NADH oxidase [Gammaproteobacteria bacterium RIFCSPLOWO2_02_FULL_61_13]|nr:MAG: NADH oxidase [Gammaproteobacteria bacterium RIFCSPLOWO2_02_FULL_61_13]
MWKPAEKIKHAPNPGLSPSTEQARASKLFSPVNLGRLALKQRTWVPAMVPWRATDDGFVTDDVVDWYSRFAMGKPGAIVVEATGIRDIPSGPLLRIGHDRFVPGLRRLTEAVRVASGGESRLLIQLIDFLSVRRRPEPAKYFAKFLQVDDQIREKLNAQNWPEEQIRAHLSGLDETALAQILSAREMESLRMGARERVTDMHLEHIRTLPQVLPDLFAVAARRARDAGFDGVELHYAHAYTMASFLSATNDRDDGYGGAKENRARLPLEVFTRVRREVGDEYCVGCRFLSDECIEGGNSVEDAGYFGAEFARAGMDFLSLSRGGKFDDAQQPQVGGAVYPYTGRSGYECMPGYISDARGPFGRNVQAGAWIRQAVRAAGCTTPIIVVGGIHGFQQAEGILQREEADIIGAARQSLADPDWFLKIRLGQGDQVRVCEYTNYCEGLDQKHKQVTCQLWDRLEKNVPGIKRTSDGRRRLTAPMWNPSV